MLIVTVEVILVALLGDPDMMETVAVGVASSSLVSTYPSQETSILPALL